VVAGLRGEPLHPRPEVAGVQRPAVVLGQDELRALYAEKRMSSYRAAARVFFSGSKRASSS